MKVFILGSYGPSLINFRGDLIKAMVEQGHEVIACAPDDQGDIEEKIEKLGAKYEPIKMNRTGMNPFEDLKLFLDLFRKLKKVNPDIILSYTIKPVIYGSLAARFNGKKKIYAMIEGSGSVIRGESLKLKILQKVLNPLYRIAFNSCEKIFFLNEDDLNLFKQKKIINKHEVIIIDGSGINLDKFKRKPLKNFDTYLFIGRLIKDKGIFEFLEASKIAKKKRPNMKFKVLGPFDTNPTAIKPAELKKWTDENIVEYLGETNDVRPYIEDSYVIVLPSYHEGQGRVLLEAMAMGRAVITTNTSGCRQTVEYGNAGFLVPVKDVNSLAKKMVETFDNVDETIKMAEKGYQRVVDVYDVNKINKKILESIHLIKETL